MREARENCEEKIKIREILREIITYFMFVWILYVVSYANSNSQTFQFQKRIKDMFVSPNLLRDFKNVGICFIQIYLSNK